MVTKDKKNRRTGQDRIHHEVPILPRQGVLDKEQEVLDKGSVPREVDGPSGPEPTRYGDWEKNGRCIDF
uniref:DUF1674 domain-containing protein n=1 Tax=Candidatus Kentrum sp. LFY TaxID=2126342 RepID=A0A450UEN3_9GAMM|nr:MAG: Protein of unknown function (DUF1674) [Candidatus Kentron sp. LFY]